MAEVSAAGMTQMEKKLKLRNDKRRTWLFLQLEQTPMPHDWAVIYGAEAESIERHLPYRSKRAWERFDTWR